MRVLAGEAQTYSQNETTDSDSRIRLWTERNQGQHPPLPTRRNRQWPPTPTPPAPPFLYTLIPGRYVLNWMLMRFKCLMISITKCPHWLKVTKTHTMGHIRYVNILTRLWGFGVKIAKFFKFLLCLNSQKRTPEESSKKTPPNREVYPEDLGAMLEYWYIECGLFCQIWSNMKMWNNPAKIWSIPIKQYLRSILDMYKQSRRFTGLA